MACTVLQADHTKSRLRAAVAAVVVVVVVAVAMAVVGTIKCKILE